MSVGDRSHPRRQSMPADDYALRIAHAQVARESFAAAMGDDGGQADAQAQGWLAGIDQREFVGSRHHVVPHFLLERWANDRGQVRVHRRIEKRHDIGNIRDLAIKDFYTVVDTNGQKNSAMESLLGVVESGAKLVIDDLLSPFKTARIAQDEIAHLARFASFQATRTPRRRREIELQATWYAKTMAQGVVPDARLENLDVAPHQNQLVEMVGKSAEELLAFFALRPLALVRLDAPRMLICDEPVIVNGPAGAFHTDDCLLTDEQVRKRHENWLRKTKKKKQGRHPPPGRVVHFSSTVPTGFGTADELALPISPTAALLWGPLLSSPPPRGIERLRLAGTEADRFAEMANDAMCTQALDWVAGRVADSSFNTRHFPPPGPLMRVCDGTSAASLAINGKPERFRPRRLTVPDTWPPG